MTLFKKAFVLSLTAIALAGCQNDADTQNEETDAQSSAETTQVETSEESSESESETSSEEASENTSESSEAQESTTSESTAANSGETNDELTGVFEEIVSLDPELSEADMESYSFMTNEDNSSDYIEINVRQDNEAGDVSSALGFYRYYPEDGTIEKQDYLSGEFEALN